MPPIQRAVRRLALVLGAIAGAIALLVGGLYVRGRLTPQHTVLVENGQPFAVDLEIGGERLHLAAHARTEVAAHDGTLRVVARGPAFTESHSIDLPSTAGLRPRGRVALYNVGAASRLAIVTVTYGTVHGAAPPVALVPSETRLTLVPEGVTGSIDEPFPAQVTTQRWGETIQHVCHADVEHRRLGCPGANEGDR